METNDTFKQRMNTLLTKWNDQINLLYAKAKNAESDAQLKYVEQLDVLHTKKREAAKLIQELENASGEVWGEVKMTKDNVWDNLRSVA